MYYFRIKNTARLSGVYSVIRLWGYTLDLLCVILHYSSSCSLGQGAQKLSDPH